jgi:catechol 2,3-dioxygenase-like lactoylglutathione lyase family enzyme
MKKIQVQGLHHITIIGSTKQSAIDFWEGFLGMPFIFEQPNLSKPEENHLYFDPGDGRLLTVFTNETRTDAARPAPRESGCTEHIAFKVSKAVQNQVTKRLQERGLEYQEWDRGFMYSIYFRDPNGLKVELAWYKFEAPEGLTDVQILVRAHKLRSERGDYNINDEHLADAIEQLVTEKSQSLSR